MQSVPLSRVIAPNNRLASFTLIELLTVMAIIAILAGLTLAALPGASEKARRSRASVEIQAMSTALEAYKTDNGFYPIGTLVAGNASDLLGPPTVLPYPTDATSAKYRSASGALFIALSGQTNFSTAPSAGIKTYMTFKANQVGSPNGPNSYIQDPWNNAYGYSTGDNQNPQVQYPFNGTGFFDLWSTAGVTQAQYAANTSLTNKWVTNWQ